MDKVLWGTEIYTGVYFDDIIIHSQTWKEHSNHVSQVLNRLDKAGLTLKLTKCKFAPLKNKVIAVKEIPKPQTKKKRNSYFSWLDWLLQKVHPRLRSYSSSTHWDDKEENAKQYHLDSTPKAILAFLHSEILLHHPLSWGIQIMSKYLFSKPMLLTLS